MAVVVKELNQSLINQANNNSMSGTRGNGSAAGYKELADKICYLIENENVRIKMGHKARENVKRFLPENVMPQWKNLFESLTYSSK